MTADDDNSGAEPTANRLDRLTAAMEAFLRWCDRTEGSDRAAFLTRHESLRDLLEPMLEDADSDRGTANAPEAVALLPGRQVGDYRIVRELGRGGMGIVFEAEQVSLRRRVALKLLHPHLAWSANSIERFRREAAIAASLRHPCIVPIHEVGEWRGLHFFSMEFVDGEPLSERLHKEQLDHSNDTRPRIAARLCAEVAAALRVAHDRGLVHRDIKPQNILLDRDGGVRLVDFGLAKDLAVPRDSATGSFVGTPHYCSPEQVTAGRDLGPASDVFSLGIVLYELLARRRPFDAETTRQVLQAIEQGEHEPLRHIAPSTPRDLETICHKALQPDPAARYRDAGELADDLRRFLRIEPILARPPSALRRGSKWLRRHRLRVAVTTTIGLLLVGVPAGYAIAKEHQREAVEQQRVVAERQRQLAENERQAADAAAELGFRSVEQTLAFVNEQLEYLPEMPVAQHSSVDDAVRMYEQFLELRPLDPKRRLRVAHALHQASYVYARLRQYAAALDIVRSASSLVAELSEPRAEQLRQRLAQRLLYLAEAHAPDVDEAAFSARTAEWRLAASTPPTAIGTVVEYVELLQLRSRWLADRPDGLEQAERLTRLAQSMLLDTADSANQAIRRATLRTEALLGVVLQRQGRSRESLPVLQAAQQALLAVELTPLLATDLVLVTAAFGEAQERLGDQHAAEASLRQAIADAAPLLPQYPGARALHHACIRAKVRLAGILMASRRADEATQLLDAVQIPTIAEETWLEVALRASVTQQRAACILLTVDPQQPEQADRKRAAARELLAEAVAQYEQLVTMQPDLARFHVDLGAALSNLAAAHNEERNYGAAADCAQRAITAQQHALRAGSTDRRVAMFLGIHHAQLSMALSFLDRPIECLEAVHAAVQHHSRNAATLRMAAEAALRCTSSPDLAAVDIERGRQQATAALAEMATFHPTEARRWLAHERFAALRDRDDFRQLADRIRQ